MRAIVGLLVALLVAAPVHAQMRTLALSTAHPCDGVHEQQFPNPTGQTMYVWGISSWLLPGSNVDSGNGNYWACLPMLDDSLMDEHFPDGRPGAVHTNFSRPYIVGPTDPIEIATWCTGGGVRYGVKLLKYTFTPP